MNDTGCEPLMTPEKMLVPPPLVNMVSVFVPVDPVRIRLVLAPFRLTSVWLKESLKSSVAPELSVIDDTCDMMLVN